jgi:hypothetical protein
MPSMTQLGERVFLGLTAMPALKTGGLFRQMTTEPQRGSTAKASITPASIGGRIPC